MPFPPNAILNGLRRAPLLTNDDYFQEQPPIGFEPGSTDAPHFRMGPPDPRLTLDAFQGRMQDEIRDRAFQSARLGDRYETAALAGLHRSYANDQADTQIGRQRNEVDDIETANTLAALKGFGTPQNAAQYERDFDLYKMGQGERTAVAQAEAQGRSQVSKQEAIRRNFIEGLQKQAELSQGGKLSPLSRLSVTDSGISMGYDTNLTDNAPRDMSGAAGLLKELPRLRAWAQGGSAEGLAAYNTAKQIALDAKQSIPPEIRNNISEMVDVPEFQGKSWNEVQAMLLSGQYGDPNKTPQEWAHLREGWNLLNGVPLPQ
jgi:hypothetical protein